MAKRSLALRIASLQYAIVRELNNMHIFLRQVAPLLEEAKTDYEESSHKKDRRYYVPSVKGGKFAKRTDAELKNIYRRFMDTSLYETFLVSAVSRFESFLVDVAALILAEYPLKLGVAVQCQKACREVPVDLLLSSSSIEDAIARVISRHLQQVFYGSPETYFRYLSAIGGVTLTDAALQGYLEIKATRDLLVHNTGVINETYLSKAGAKARGALGETVAVDTKYFDHCVATLKRVAGIVKRDTGKQFPHAKREKDPTTALT